jgi:ClpP class serine protease
VIAEVIAGHIAGKVNPAADGLKNIAAKQEVTMVSGMAVVPIHGVLMQRASLFDNISGATSYPAIQKNMVAAMETGTKVVLLDVDSPGGEAIGCEETADMIYSMRGKGKLLVAFTDRMMASGAYWLACQADFVFATGDSIVGSIGALMNIPDTSRMEKNQGLDRRIIRSGANKAPGIGAVTDEQLQPARERVEECANAFWSSVERARNTELDANAKSGRTWTGLQAEKQFLIDGVMTFSALVKKYGS